MYVQGSLRNQGDGFVFQVQNKIDSGSTSGLSKVFVDEEERSLDGATVQIGEKLLAASQISWSSPLYVSYGATLTIYVPGPLGPGEHTITLQVNTPELGRLSFPITDKVA
jgi:hypothetical protein